MQPAFLLEKMLDNLGSMVVLDNYKVVPCNLLRGAADALHRARADDKPGIAADG